MLNIVKKVLSLPAPKKKGILDWNKGTVELFLSDASDSQRLFSCRKEPETVAWIEREMKPGAVLYDVGANVGAYSLIAGKLTDPSGRVIAFEPGYASFKTLCDNIFLNDLQVRILPLPIALSNKEGILTLNFSSLESGAAKHSVSENADSQNALGILSAQLDWAVEHLDLPSPTMLKIDVDGGELGVLEGAHKTLRNPSLKTILIEVDHQEPGANRIIPCIETAGFALREKHAREKGQSDHLFNYIFDRV